MAINITTDCAEERRWRAITLPELITQSDIDKIILACSDTVVLRVIPCLDGKHSLQSYCASDAEHAKAESLVSQALADQRLRIAIGEKGCVDVMTLVETILLRSGNRKC